MSQAEDRLHRLRETLKNAVDIGKFSNLLWIRQLYVMPEATLFYFRPLFQVVFNRTQFFTAQNKSLQPEDLKKIKELWTEQERFLEDATNRKGGGTPHLFVFSIQLRAFICYSFFQIQLCKKCCWT